jgi:hypothetical protein
MASRRNREPTGQRNSPGCRISFSVASDDKLHNYLKMFLVNFKPFQKGCSNNCLEITENQLQRGVIS